MKAKSLAKILGITKRYNYESALYKETSAVSNSKDFLVEEKLPTREGHLEWAMRMYKSGILFN